MVRRGRRLSAQDKSILTALEPIVDGIAALLGKHVEVNLHSFETNTITKLRNGHVTGRSVGNPTGFGIEALTHARRTEGDVLGSYFMATEDGRTLKSMSVIVRNRSGRAVGLFCVNMDLSAPLIDFAASLRVDADDDEEFDEIISPQDLVDKTFKTVSREVNNLRRTPNIEKNKQIVGAMYDKGMFDIRGAVEIVAEELGVSRYTIYNYIREAKTPRRRT